MIQQFQRHRRTLLGLASLLGLGLGSGLAVPSGCTALYALTNTNNVSQLHFINNRSELIDIATFTGLTSVNGAALDPVTGNVYYINRSTATTNDLRVFNTNTRADSLIAAVPLPATGAVTVGASFDNSMGTSRLFILYNNYTVQEVSKTTGAVQRTLSMTLPTTDTGGRPLQKPTAAVSNTTTTSGDMVFVGGTLYGAVDGETTTAGAVYYVNLGTPPTTGTTGTLTGSSAVRLVNSATGNTYAVKAVNGISINPVSGLTFVTTANNVGSVNTVSGVVTNTGTTANGYSDLSDCNVLPETAGFTKSFGTGTVRNGAGTTLTISLTNTNTGAYYTQATITDTLPSGVTVAAAVAPAQRVTGTCLLASGVNAAPSVSIAADGSSLTLPSNIRVPQGGCSFDLNILTSTRGAKVNTIPASSLDTTVGSTTTNATAPLLVNDPAAATIVKTQRIIPVGAEAATTATTSPVNAAPGRTVEYCITATHLGVGYAPATRAVISDILNNNLTLQRSRYNGGNNDASLTKNGVTTFVNLTLVPVTNNGVTQQSFSVSALPFDSSNATATLCFQASVK